MSKGNTTENDVLALIFNKTLASWAGTLATTGQADLYVALYTADPGEGGAPNNNEAAYTNYARVSVVRTSSGWTVSGNQVSNTALVQFPECGASGATITHAAIVTSASGGSGQILYSGALNAPRTVAEGIQPQFNIGNLVVQED